MIAFEPTVEQAEVARRIAGFVADEVIPREAEELHRRDGIRPATVEALRLRARAAGVYGPQLPAALGGLGLDWR
ncbi:MAG TPA: acyl-CoA dehydrogenase family protein, partial [Chloroflexota bacterium]